MSLLLLNVLDIATTVPRYEINPVTLLFWQKIGIIPSALFKIGLVIIFGGLLLVAKRVVNSNEWEFTSNLFEKILILLVAYYAFVVTSNATIFFAVSN